MSNGNPEPQSNLATILGLFMSGVVVFGVIVSIACFCKKHHRHKVRHFFLTKDPKYSDAFMKITYEISRQFIFLKAKKLTIQKSSTCLNLKNKHLKITVARMVLTFIVTFSGILTYLHTNYKHNTSQVLPTNIKLRT